MISVLSAAYQIISRYILDDFVAPLFAVKYTSNLCAPAAEGEVIV